jgi:hypothetical protein
MRTDLAELPLLEQQLEACLARLRQMLGTAPASPGAALEAYRHAFTLTSERLAATRREAQEQRKEAIAQRQRLEQVRQELIALRQSMDLLR